MKSAATFLFQNNGFTQQHNVVPKCFFIEALDEAHATGSEDLLHSSSIFQVGHSSICLDSRGLWWP